MVSTTSVRLVTAADSVAALKEQAKVRGMTKWSALRKAELRGAIEAFDKARGFNGATTTNVLASAVQAPSPTTAAATTVDTDPTTAGKRKRDPADDDSEDESSSDDSSSSAAPSPKKAARKATPKKSAAKPAAKKASKAKATNWATSIDPVVSAEYTEKLVRIGSGSFYVSCDGIWDSVTKVLKHPLRMRAYDACGDKVAYLLNSSFVVSKFDSTTAALDELHTVDLHEDFMKERKIYSRIAIADDKVFVLNGAYSGFYDIPTGEWEKVTHCDYESSIAYGLLVVHPETREGFWFYAHECVAKYGKRLNAISCLRTIGDPLIALALAPGCHISSFMDSRDNEMKLVTAGNNEVHIHTVDLPDNSTTAPEVFEIKSISVNHKHGVSQVAVDSSTGIMATGGSWSKEVFFWDVYDTKLLRGKCIGKVTKLGDGFPGHYVGACTKFHVQALCSVTTDPSKPVFVTGNSNNADDDCVKLVHLKPTTREITRPLDPKTQRKKAKAKKRGGGGGGGGFGRGRRGCSIM